jgi:hypothetical protein
MAITSLQGNRISWVEPVTASSYIVKRSRRSDGPYEVIARGVKQNNFIDKKAVKGTTYYYTVNASNQNGYSREAYPVGITAGLPMGWIVQALNALSYAAFDGTEFKLESSGTRIDSVVDSGEYLKHRIGNKGGIIARYIPQLSSQLSNFGLMICTGSSAHPEKIMLLVSPRATGQPEAPHWEIKMLKRVRPGKEEIISTLPLENDRVVTHARLTGFLWLKIEFAGRYLHSYYSADGIKWIAAGSGALSRRKKNDVGGLFISSGVQGLSTTIRFDHVSVK